MFNKYLNKTISFLKNQKEENMRMRHMLSHPKVSGYPTVRTIITKDIKPTKQDKFVVIRLLEAYEKATFDEKRLMPPKDDMRSVLKNSAHADFFPLLQEKNIDTLAYYLCNMARMDVTQGITQGINMYKRIISNKNYQRWLSLYNLDKLISLAEALGILPKENPEQGRFGVNIFSDTDELIEKIERYLKIKIIPPDIEGGLFKLLTKNGSIHTIDLIAVYTAWRIKEVLKQQIEPSVCEIGAGVGKVAYYTNLLGIKKYTIIDLPYINILQGFYLIKSLPDAKVCLYGEKIKHAEEIISIQPYWSFKRITNKYFNLVLNQDSFPEINEAVVIDYLKDIKRNTKDYFLNINQESQGSMFVSNTKQNRVPELVKKAKGFELIYRFPYWMRQGYVEELYKVY